jgi:Fic family protein
VRNYILAMQHAIGELSRLPLCNRLLKEAHRTLMSNVRGEHKMSGDFRTSQNWIGGDSLEGASFIPPPSEEVPNLMSDLEKFWHNDAIAVPHLIRIAISHYQFETIHPFLDGNGRIGRLLIPLYLMSHGLLKKPSLYVSAHLEKNRQAYYDALTKVRMSNDLVHWIKFFLEAIHDTALLGIETFETILALRTQAEKKVRGLGARSGKGYKLLEHLYQNPSISRTQAAEALGVSFPTAASLLAEFVRLGLLQAMPGDARTRQYVFGRYLACFTAVRPRPATAAIANPPKLQ